MVKSLQDNPMCIPPQKRKSQISSHILHIFVPSNFRRVKRSSPKKPEKTRNSVAFCSALRGSPGRFQRFRGRRLRRLGEALQRRLAVLAALHGGVGLRLQGAAVEGACPVRLMGLDVFFLINPISIYTYIYI